MVGEGSLVGMGSRLLGRTRIGRECIVAAGAVVPPGMEVPDRMLAMGMPARIVRQVTEDELAYMRDVAARYVELARRHVNGEFLNRSAV
jgi:carbonic anhydrase/acetyltransferase-like protein (isoleucine patch superfamily)